MFTLKSIATLKTLQVDFTPPIHQVVIDCITVSDYPKRKILFQAIVNEAKRPGISICLGLNLYNANMANQYSFLKKMYQQSQIVYCEGVGVLLASRLLGNKIQHHYPQRDMFFEMWDFFTAQNCTSYYLGSAPGIALKGLSIYAATRSNHTVLGVHHGNILDDTALEAKVIAEINALKPDVLFVGMGCPLQEKWIIEHMHELNVGLCFAAGASIIHAAGKQHNTQNWLARIGSKRFFHLSNDPQLLFQQYLIGGIWFLDRVILNLLGQKLKVKD